MSIAALASVLAGMERGRERRANTAKKQATSDGNCHALAVTDNDCTISSIDINSSGARRDGVAERQHLHRCACALTGAVSRANATEIVRAGGNVHTGGDGSGSGGGSGDTLQQEVSPCDSQRIYSGGDRTTNNNSCCCREAGVVGVGTGGESSNTRQQQQQPQQGGAVATNSTNTNRHNNCSCSLETEPRSVNRNDSRRHQCDNSPENTTMHTPRISSTDGHVAVEASVHRPVSRLFASLLEPDVDTELLPPSPAFGPVPTTVPGAGRSSAVVLRTGDVEVPPDGRRLELLVHNVSHKDMVLSIRRTRLPARKRQLGGAAGNTIYAVCTLSCTLRMFIFPFPFQPFWTHTCSDAAPHGLGVEPDSRVLATKPAPSHQLPPGPRYLREDFLRWLHEQYVSPENEGV